MCFINSYYAYSQLNMQLKYLKLHTMDNTK